LGIWRARNVGTWDTLKNETTDRRVEKRLKQMPASFSEKIAIKNDSSGRLNDCRSTIYSKAFLKSSYISRYALVAHGGIRYAICISHSTLRHLKHRMGKNKTGKLFKKYMNIFSHAELVSGKSSLCCI